MFQSFVNRLRVKFSSTAEAPSTTSWLAAISFAESSFFPIPVDVFYIPVLLTRERPQWFRFGCIIVAASVLGGLFGYAIGYFLFDTVGRFLIELYNFEDKFLSLQSFFAEHAFLTVLAGGATPLPYKLFTIGAGFFSVNLWIFLAASVVSRAFRFFIVIYVVKWFGVRVANLIMSRLGLWTFMALVVAGFVAAYFLL